MILLLAATGVLAGFLCYALAMFLLGRGGPGPSPEPAAPSKPGPRYEPLFVFLIPCLDEEPVLASCLERLLALPQRDWRAIVIDDGSADGTAAEAERFLGPRIHLLRRTPPQARHGKGAALNAGLRYLCQRLLLEPGLRARDPQGIVVVVVDADGRLDSTALDVVAPHFAKPEVGAVQIGVRIHNAAGGLLARMQDLEFVAYTEIFQRARSRIGSAGLGGNGQFTRLTALLSLDGEPWTDCLCEDLDLGIRLVTTGWRSVYEPRARVQQQGLTGLRQLLRQRARWFQGHLQASGRLGRVLSARLRARVAADLVVTLTLPALVLLTSFSVLAFYATVGGFLSGSREHVLDLLGAHRGLSLAVWAVIALGMLPVCAWCYARAEPRSGLLRTAAWAALFSLYAYHWLLVGWWALGRQALRRRGWAKTARLRADDSSPAAHPESPGGGDTTRLGPTPHAPELED